MQAVCVCMRVCRRDRDREEVLLVCVRVPILIVGPTMMDFNAAVLIDYNKHTIVEPTCDKHKNTHARTHTRTFHFCHIIYYGNNSSFSSIFSLYYRFLVAHHDTMAKHRRIDVFIETGRI